MRASSSHSRSPSIISIPDSDGSDYVPIPNNKGDDGSPIKKTSVKRKRSSIAPTRKNDIRSKAKADIDDDIGLADIEDIGPIIRRDHDQLYHKVDEIVKVQEDLLTWFENCREKRGMPWRKKYNPELSMDQKGQRAYEIWVSEVMLQQTQVNTVIAYWERWIEKWPTITDLAKADVEEVNAMWRGLGYYRRARSLLAGAKTVMSKTKYQGRLPDDPIILEKEIDGVGRYTAGAICSIAYGIRTPIVDGNIHRLFTRLLALHAPQTAPSTIKSLWTSAEELVGRLPKDKERKGITGDWNQALMELGSQVCKPLSPDCQVCPLKSSCKAYAELSSSPPKPSERLCTLCAPIPLSTSTEKIPSVTIFPMRKEKKTSRVEDESVLVLEWKGEEGKRRWLFVKRPEKGLLAGLFEPPTTPVPTSSKPKDCLQASLKSLTEYIKVTARELAEVKTYNHISSIPHIFSHINMTYHVHHFILSSTISDPPEILSTSPRVAIWMDDNQVEHANVGTGVKKVWAEVYGSWGSFDENHESFAEAKTKTASKKIKEKKPLEEVKNGKVVKKIMMPMMPVKKIKEM
ncbi:A/G-specific adenine glycosylase [Kwoniella shivajii]|uniref:Adenine DNA glycosylase n=1 Tax=Kwoniella shivajii TaxID=564305 RepID=A0ABZ1CY05_9TREE|nr:A/G-specific adenine glycosylase [Kwoniella shivajii]